MRDLGGLAVAGGGVTRRGAAVRADALDRLTAAGWAALWAHGVRTVIDLRDDAERAPDVAPRPAGLTTVHLPLDGSDDRAFWAAWESGPQFGTPLYYRPHLERFPERSVAVLAAFAGAAPGGVAFHCGRGRDRAGQVAMLLLALAGVAPGDIAADYALSGAADPPDERAALDAFLAAQGTTAADAVVATLAGLDVAAHLRAAGLTDAQRARIRARLVGRDR